LTDLFLGPDEGLGFVVVVADELHLVRLAADLDTTLGVDLVAPEFKARSWPVESTLSGPVREAVKPMVIVSVSAAEAGAATTVAAAKSTQSSFICTSLVASSSRMG
jgi:hypothetical protein